MAKQVPWNKIFLDEFISLAMLTEEEQSIMRTRIAGWTITEQAQKLSMSESKVNSIISRLKHKYDIVQPYSEILPPRKSSAEEIYMDTH